jgi:hypothetical protein
MHGALVLGRDLAFRYAVQAQPRGQPARLDRLVAKLASRRRFAGRRMGEVPALAGLAETIDEPSPVVRCFNHQARELRVIRRQVGQDGVELVGQPLFMDHLILGIQQRQDTVVRVSINTPIQPHGRSP